MAMIVALAIVGGGSTYLASSGAKPANPPPKAKTVETPKEDTLK